MLLRVTIPDEFLHLGVEVLLGVPETGRRGTARAQGSVDQATIKLSGSGEAKLGDLAMKQLKVDISGSGKVEAAPKDSADVRISGSGDVKLLSRPANLTSKVSGSGRISQVQ